MAARELEHHDLLVERLRELGQDPEVVMNRFVPGFEAFHQRTRPATWLEGLVKAYVGDGIALDFYGEAARFVDDRTREVIERARADDGKTDLIVDTVRGAVAVDPRVRGRGIGHAVVARLVEVARELDLGRVFVLTFEVDFFARHGFVEIDGTPVTAEVYAEMRRSYDAGVAEFLDLSYVKPNTLGNTRMLLTL